jgi:hypothetical protein
MPVIGTVFGIQEPSCPVVRPSGLSLLNSPELPSWNSTVKLDVCSPQSFHVNNGHRVEPGNPWRSQHSAPTSFMRDSISVVRRFAFATALLVACPPVLAQPGYFRPTGAFTSGLPAFGSPLRLPGITTTPHWDLRRRDFHPQAQQLVSLRRFLGNPFESVPRARDSGGPGTTSHSARPDTAFRQVDNVGTATTERFRS